jgi:tetratricopeptide (TPR) repeat protein
MDNNIIRRESALARYFILGLLLIATAVAAETATEYFDRGVSAAQRQQYPEALSALLKAKAAGLETPDLDYNLGVVYYQLARYDEAVRRFQLLINIPEYTAIAYYNLGLIALKRDDRQAALENFSTASTLAVDENLKNLSQRALQRLNEDPVEKKSLFTGWGGFVSFNGGYDDNVSLIDEDTGQAAGIADYHAELFASTGAMLLGSDASGLHMDANVNVLKQQKEHDYDYSQWHVALAHEGLFSRWETRARAAIDRTQFGNVDFQQLLSLELNGKRDLSAKSGFELRYKYADIADKSPDGAYDYLTGNRHQLRLRFLDSRKGVGLKYSYEVQINDRNDFSFQSTNASNETTSITRSYSPIRHSVQVSADVPWSKSLTINLEAQYRYSDYIDPDTNTMVDGTGDIISATSLIRKDHRYRFNIGMAYNITPSWELFADYGHTKNDSNRPGSDYQRTLMRAGVTWFY